MKNRVAYRPQHGLGSFWGNAVGWRLKIVGPFHDTPVQNTGADATAEQHGRPAQGGEFGLTVAQANIPMAAKGEIEQEGKGK